VPGFNPIQDYVITTSDAPHEHGHNERLQESELQQAAVSMAWFAYNAANLDRRSVRSSATALTRL